MLIPRYSPELIPLDGYTRSASAVMLAVERLGRENLINDVNFTFVWRYEECNEHTALGFAVQLILNESIDLLVGPPCNALVVMCFELNAQKRRFMEAAKAKGMSNPEYVYIFPDVDNTGFGIGNYEDWTNYVKDGSEDILEIFQYALVLDNKSDRMTKNFSEEVMSHMKGYPFYCTTDCPTNVTVKERDEKLLKILIDYTSSSLQVRKTTARAIASRYAGSLYDTMYMYGLALNKSLDDDPINGWRHGSQILSYATGTFNGDFTSSKTTTIVQFTFKQRSYLLHLEHVKRSDA
uniref:ANF_receptor domain-containing protein n=1 Tax=Ascaris lumbricoides TaxID=6252 RepID=A0A0M3I6W9_ASCLU